MKKRILACFMCLCMVLSFAPTIVFADDIQVGEVDDEEWEKEWEYQTMIPDGPSEMEVKGGGKDSVNGFWSPGYQDSGKVIRKSGNYTINIGDGSVDKLEVKHERLEINTVDAGEVHIKIRNLTMDLTKDKQGFFRTRSAISIHKDSKATKVTLEFIGTNIIKSYMGAGIVNETNCDLNIIGTGSLTVEGGEVRLGKSSTWVEGIAGIVLDIARNTFDEKNKTLCLGYAAIMGRCTLNHENIIAKGGGFAAGIGNGFPTDQLDLGNFIKRAIETARKILDLVRGLSIEKLKEFFKNEKINDINITGGTVNATGGPGGGAGIGGCAYLYNSSINITGGNVTATGGNYEKEGKKIGGGAGIGGGCYGAGEKISIEGTEKNRTTVTATGGYGAAAIGGGIGLGKFPNSGNARLIKIGNYSTVTATAENTNGAAIGCGDKGNPFNLLDAGDYFIQVGSTDENGKVNGKGIEITTNGGYYGMGAYTESSDILSQKMNIYGGHITFNNCTKPFRVNPNMGKYDGKYSIIINGSPVEETKTVYTGELTGKKVFEIRPTTVTGDNVIGSLEELDNTSTDNKNQDEGKNSNLVDSLVDSKASSKITDSKAFKTGENNNMLVIYILTSTVSLVCVAFVLRKGKSFNK